MEITLILLSFPISERPRQRAHAFFLVIKTNIFSLNRSIPIRMLPQLKKIRRLTMLITSEPKNNIYRSLIDLAFDLCDEFILVLHKEYRIFDSAKSIIEKLKPYLIEMKEQSTWAGTQLYEDTACVYHYRTSTRAREIIKEVSSAFISVDNNLIFPEDLSFYKNGKPWLMKHSP